MKGAWKVTVSLQVFYKSKIIQKWKDLNKHVIIVNSQLSKHVGRQTGQTQFTRAKRVLGKGAIGKLGGPHLKVTE